MEGFLKRILAGFLDLEGFLKDFEGFSGFFKRILTKFLDFGGFLKDFEGFFQDFLILKDF